MTISPESYFRSPPKILQPKQVLIFNAIRYSLDICDFAFERLKDNLYKFSYPEVDLVPAFPILYSDVWTIVNNATIFYNVVTRLFDIDKADPIFEKVRGVELFRHSHQHLDARIDEILLIEDLPIYGSLSWYAQKESNSHEGIIFTLNSGTITHRKTIKSTVVNPAGKLNQQTTNDIELSMPVRVNNNFEIKTIKINELVSEFKTIIEHFEVQLSDQLKVYEPLERHANDLIISIHVKKF